MQSTASARFIVLALFLAAVNGLKVSNFPGKVLQRNQYVEPVLNGDATISVLAKFCAYPIPWKLGQPDPNRYLVSTLEIKSDTHAKDCKIVVAAINRLLASFRPGLRPIGCEQFKHYPDKSFFGLNYTYPYTPDEEKEIEAIEIALDKLLGTKRGVNPIKFGFSGSVNAGANYTVLHIGWGYEDNIVEQLNAQLRPIRCGRANDCIQDQPPSRVLQFVTTIKQCETECGPRYTCSNSQCIQVPFNASILQQNLRECIEGIPYVPGSRWEIPPCMRYSCADLMCSAVPYHNSSLNKQKCHDGCQSYACINETCTPVGYNNGKMNKGDCERFCVPKKTFGTILRGSWGSFKELVAGAVASLHSLHN